MTPLKVLYSESADARSNLALEENLFAAMAPDERILLLYCNSQAIIIGRNQNPWSECSLPDIAAASIPVFRRFSGGGTVYHDPGNLNFSYMTPRNEFSRTAASVRAAAALEDLGIEAEVTERGDILVDGRKVSGSAYRITGDKAYHHATLLVNADTAALGRMLHSRITIVSSRATPSVPSPVTNLSAVDDTITVEQAVAALTAAFLPGGGSAEKIRPENAPLPRLYRSCWDQLGTADWQLGKTPRFTFKAAAADRKEGYLVTAEGGRITAVSHASAGAGRKNAEEIEAVFKGELLTRRDLEAASRRSLERTGTVSPGVSEFFTSLLQVVF
jgi:lipoate---protein ligase